LNGKWNPYRKNKQTSIACFKQPKQAKQAVTVNKTLEQHRPKDGVLRGASCGNTQPAFYTHLFHLRPCVRADKVTVTDRHKKRAKKPEKLGSDSR
jgi:hypothetical protein